MAERTSWSLGRALRGLFEKRTIDDQTWDDLETALATARETAGDKNISVMGAHVGRQLLDAGEIDEISVHLVPVLFGSGTPMFGEGVREHITLEFVGVSESPHATHLRYRVVRDG